MLKKIIRLKKRDMAEVYEYPMSIGAKKLSCEL